MLPLSVSIIGHNESANIRRCLASVRGWVAEIVLVVNDCTDGTDRIAAQEFGARVIPHPWLGHRDQKNIALDQCAQPWVLALDCDEEVSPEMRQSLAAFFASPPPDGLHGAIFNRRNWLLGRWIRHGEWYPDRHLRLVRRGCARWTGAMEHDRLTLTSGSARRLPGDLLHYSFPTLGAQVRKVDYYAEAFKRRKRAEGRRWRPLEGELRAAWRFFLGYVLRLGFLDGFPGFVLAATMAYYTLIRYAKLYEAELPTLPADTSPPPPPPSPPPSEN